MAFDTNVLYTDISHHLLRLDVKELIRAHSGHEDVEVEWLVPEGVIEERRYQMLRAAGQLQKSVQNYSELLGMTIECSDDQLAAHVDRCIREGMQEIGLRMIPLEALATNWAQLQRAAWHRQPPFQQVPKHEKGFRDALILETFSQIVESAPISTIVVLVCSDEFLANTAESRFANCKNVRVFSDIAEVSGLINTFVENVTEEHVMQIAKKCELLFFDTKNSESPDSLWRKWELGPMVAKVFASANDLEGLDSQERLSYSISAPVMLQKTGIRWQWLSRLTRVDSGIDKSQQVLQTGGASVPSIADISQIVGESIAATESPPESRPKKRMASSVLGLMVGTRMRVTRHCDVVWEIGVQSDGKIRKPELIRIDLGPMTKEPF